MKIYKILSLLLEHINMHFNIECDYILESIKSIFDFITFSSMNNKQIQDIYNFSLSKNQQQGITLIHRLCNVPFYFILHKQGKNVLFPALIAITYNNEKNLNLLSNSLNSKHLQLWLKQNIYSDVYKDLLSMNKNKENNSNNHQHLMQKEFVTKSLSKCGQIVCIFIMFKLSFFFFLFLLLCVLICVPLYFMHCINFIFFIFHFYHIYFYCFEFLFHFYKF